MAQRFCVFEQGASIPQVQTCTQKECECAFARKVRMKKGPTVYGKFREGRYAEFEWEILFRSIASLPPSLSPPCAKLPPKKRSISPPSLLLREKRFFPPSILRTIFDNCLQRVERGFLNDFSGVENGIEEWSGVGWSSFGKWIYPNSLEKSLALKMKFCLP